MTKDSNAKKVIEQSILIPLIEYICSTTTNSDDSVDYLVQFAIENIALVIYDSNQELLRFISEHILKNSDRIFKVKSQSSHLGKLKILDFACLLA